MADPRSALSLGVATSVLALGTVLLPFAGALERWVAFRAGGVVPPNLAWHLPIPDLAWYGFAPVVSPGISLVAFLFFARAVAPTLHLLATMKRDLASVKPHVLLDRVTALSRQGKALAEQHEQARQRRDELATTAPSIDDSIARGAAEAVEANLQRLEREEDGYRVAAAQLHVAVDSAEELLQGVNLALDSIEAAMPPWYSFFGRIPSWLISRWSVVGLYLILTALAAVFLPFQLLPLLVIGIGGGWWLIRTARRHGRLAFGDVALRLVLLMLLGSLFWGLYPSRPQAREYSFSNPTAGLEDGAYAMVAESDGFQYLLPCSTSSWVIAVPLAAVQSVRLPLPISATPAVPSLWEVVVDRRPLRFGFLPPAC